MKRKKSLSLEADGVTRRFEVLSPPAMRLQQISLCLSETLGVAVLIVVVVCRQVHGENLVQHHVYIPWMNTVIGFIIFVILQASAQDNFRQIWKHRRAKAYWSRERYYSTAIAWIEWASETANLLMFLAANIFVLSTECKWFTATVRWLHFAQWICWDTLLFCSVMRARKTNLWLDKNGKHLGKTPDCTMDYAPAVRANLAGIVVWWIIAMLLVLLIALDQFGVGTDRHPSDLSDLVVPSSQIGQPDCHNWDYICTWGPHVKAISTVLILSFVLYVVLFFAYLTRTFAQLRTRPKREHHVAHAYARTALHFHAVCVIFFVLCTIVYFFVEFDTCQTRYLHWLGLLPMHICYGIIAAWAMYCNAPVGSSSYHRRMQLGLQQFAWTEEDKGPQLQLRQRILAGSQRVLAGSQKEPMFCFETAVKLYYFSHLVYCYQRAIHTAFQESETEKAEKEKVVLELASSDVLPETQLHASPSISTQHLQLSRRANLLSAEKAALSSQNGSGSALQDQQDSDASTTGSVHGGTSLPSLEELAPGTELHPTPHHLSSIHTADSNDLDDAEAGQAYNSPRVALQRQSLSGVTQRYVRLGNPLGAHSSKTSHSSAGSSVLRRTMSVARAFPSGREAQAAALDPIGPDGSVLAHSRGDSEASSLGAAVASTSTPELSTAAAALEGPTDAPVPQRVSRSRWPLIGGWDRKRKRSRPPDHLSTMGRLRADGPSVVQQSEESDMQQAVEGQQAEESEGSSCAERFSWVQSLLDLFGLESGCFAASSRSTPVDIDVPEASTVAEAEGEGTDGLAEPSGNSVPCACCGESLSALAQLARPPRKMTLVGVGQKSHSKTGQRGSHRPSRDHRRRARRNRRRVDLLLDAALQLYDLDRIDVIAEQEHDTHALLAWGPRAAVVVFRGTASWANIRSDLKVWSVAHPPSRGSFWLGTHPRVHGGFHTSWTANGLQQLVLDQLTAIVNEACDRGTVGQEGFQVYVTGHSLGGAMAVLAAYDIALALKPLPTRTRVSCYTFGAPRVGNHAFARDCDAIIPDQWSLINDQDAVTRQAKFMIYKRGGHRAIINHQGDMVVRPTFIEMSVHNRPGASSVSQHWLSSYKSSLLAVCLAQLSPRTRLPGGEQFLQKLLQGSCVLECLAPAGMTAEQCMKWLQRLVSNHGSQSGQGRPSDIERLNDTLRPAPSLTNSVRLSESSDGADYELGEVDWTSPKQP
ncbi:hypothetical protein WJX73_010669 [Symbiochloris irregularis]|uniref:Fungal lipase-type domain-containing protein n=1 Tax=Symbiochloris irregularis TaxID=706552 RepID=A0AAW1NRU3_9CHLO